MAALCACMSAAAQEYNDFFTFRPDKKVRKNVINISYLSDKIELSDKGVNLGDIFDEAAGIARGTNVGARSNWGVSLTYVHTYMLHRKPIARMLGFGLDVSFADVSYANYTIDNMDNWGMIDPDDFDAEHDPTKRLDVPMHKVEYSLQIGPSVTLTPGATSRLRDMYVMRPHSRAYISTMISTATTPRCSTSEPRRRGAT